MSDLSGPSVTFSDHQKAAGNGKHDLVSEFEQIMFLFG